MKIAIVTNGYFPVPPSKGGAVETLVFQLVEQNENSNNMEFVVFSCFDQEALSISKGYENTSFIFVKTPRAIRVADRIIYFLAKHILRKKKHMSYRYGLQRLYFINYVGRQLSQHPVDRIVFENHPILLRALRVSDNGSHYSSKYYYHMHNVISGFFGCQHELTSCRKILGVSEYAIGEMISLCNGEIDPAKLVVLKNKVDRRKFNGVLSEDKRSELRQRHSIPAGAKVVLFAGRFTYEKGALELIKAFAKLSNDNSVLLVLGSYYYKSGMESDYEKEMREAAESLTDRILFTGYVNHDAMPQYYALADVVVAPSIGSDSAPLAVIEPLTAGCPLVTTNMGGIPEYATDGVDSILLDVGDGLVDNLSWAIDAILDGEIVLERRRDACWDCESFYNDFIKEVAE